MSQGGREREREGGKEREGGGKGGEEKGRVREERMLVCGPQFSCVSCVFVCAPTLE